MGDNDLLALPEDGELLTVTVNLLSGETVIVDSLREGSLGAHLRQALAEQKPLREGLTYQLVTGGRVLGEDEELFFGDVCTRFADFFSHGGVTNFSATIAEVQPVCTGRHILFAGVGHLESGELLIGIDVRAGPGALATMQKVVKASSRKLTAGQFTALQWEERLMAVYLDCDGQYLGVLVYAMIREPQQGAMLAMKYIGLPEFVAKHFVKTIVQHMKSEHAVTLADLPADPTGVLQFDMQVFLETQMGRYEDEKFWSELLKEQEDNQHWTP